MRKTVLVPVEKVLCDAHIAKDGTEVEASSTLALGRYSWDLCLEHDVVFGRYLCDALGTPAEGEATESEPLSAPVPEFDPAPVVEPSPVVAECEAQDASEEANEPEPVRSVMIAGEVPGYDWDTAREAVRNLGYEVVGRADDSTVLLILGERGEHAGHKLRDAAERGLPVMDVQAPGRFKDAVRAGELVGGDPIPEPVKTGRSGMSERERNRLVRSWARENGYKVPDKGRIPMHVRHAYELSRKTMPEGKAVAA
ncbi:MULTISPECIES: Lsr2 family DNA-binding protein [Streptomyces]|uniref:Lsr2 family DNA-binding protein n=1 Tax=Streptomyces TaxID=1883 RepID=UPI00163B631E|nr:MULTISPECIES: histone-like nucleoid-structuring protein Lsr2 [Streptomyces]MBC2873969.1 Lsr2 family protein [Streptomyces sp. TYQ1024]UBI39090.1 Lsr2 family protein [Streptomyces mobaraensis]UKW31668.1 Lsr2 family protein [Streptomyces sp. TYQ1024]